MTSPSPNWHAVHMTTDLSRYEYKHASHEHFPYRPGREERIRRVAGQIVRVTFYSKDDEHIYWLVHPEDRERLTPDFPVEALVCSCVVECD